MGLGPPICFDCKIIMMFNDDTGYYCPLCLNQSRYGSPELPLNLWELPKDQQEICEKNYEKYKEENK